MRSSSAFTALVISLPSTLLLSLTLAPAALAYSSGAVEIEVTRPIDCTRKTKNGDSIQVHYKGTLQSDGSEFDESYKRGEPFAFTLGAGMVIKGWDKGLLDMCIGEGRTLTIPPELGYGHRDMGDIPPDSTLVFETELMGIKGVKAGQAPEDIASPSSPSSSSDAEFSIATAPPQTSSVSSPKESQEKNEKENSGECKLLGPFALIVQAALGVLAVLSVVWKRYRERPRRQLKVWFFDVSKQVLGSALLHVLNLLMSMFSSGDFDTAVQKAADANGNTPNPCSFYLLNLAIDTTIGIPILVISLKVLHALFAHTALANPPESIRSGHYSSPPRTTWWLKQSLIYFIGLIIMKLCVFALFQLLPWIAWVGDWALRWTEGNAALQITFVMFVFPLIMNMVQYYIIDSFIKEKSSAESQGEHEQIPQHDEEDSDEDSVFEAGDERERLVAEERKAGGTKSEALKEVNPTPIPRRREDYDPSVDGEGSSSPGVADDKK
ncbi:hypothetical protein K402DRAFT_464185 [Aulographum hederae CBS 113979]|uniref:peptidylprolyl isomerase n=1 Tax=Aulographum hederae CBS 113979 TaxID=1176131 RepID=A0A6G1GYN5_9PEZI|nr:hypothetical protein K402DRAFT_464185 [Aulographum hederae CBS 113979]